MWTIFVRYRFGEGVVVGGVWVCAGCGGGLGRNCCGECGGLCLIPSGTLLVLDGRS
jgi:hypothetical protein